MNRSGRRTVRIYVLASTGLVIYYACFHGPYLHNGGCPLSLKDRPMRRKDVRECVEIVTAHPVIGRRYENATADLEKAWLRVLDCEAKTAVVFEEGGARTRIWGVGVSVFVSDAFMQELKTPPFFWIGPELAKRVARGQSPILSDKEAREANSRGGLNLVTWEGCIRPEDAKRAEAYNRLIQTFIELHRGYLWKEIIGPQAESVERFESTIRTGGMLLNPSSGQWVDSLHKPAHEIVQGPHVLGVRREIEAERPGSWAGMLFDYQVPRLKFSRSEQRLLFAAFRGLTDEEISEESGISLSAAKKTWRSIYDRVSFSLPELIPTNSGADEITAERTKEKKRRLIAYLREHPEELRPVSRRILQRKPGTERRSSA